MAKAYPGAFPFMALQLVDSQLATTREFWRSKYWNATAEEASDPRPFREVLAARNAEPIHRRDGDAA